MNKPNTRNMALALVGLLALGIYILACTSFSPDDTKVLYPAFDPASGAVGMAVYDRETKGTEMLFLPHGYQVESNKLVAVPSLLRAAWLSSGREIVVSYCSNEKPKNDHGSIGLALIPWGMRQPIRVLRLPTADNPEPYFLFPLCVAGDRVFLSISTNGIARVDPRAGTVTTHQFEQTAGEVLLLPAPDGKSVFCLESPKRADEKTVFSRLNPDDFSRTPIAVITNKVLDDAVFTYDNTGRTLAFLSEGKETNTLVVLRDGRQIFARSLDTRGQERSFGNAILDPNGKALWATFQQTKGTNTSAYGLIEIPFNDAPAHVLMLISNAPAGGSGSSACFQAGISHDGKTAAIASTYLACTDQDFRAADCALFLVDLSKPEWPVTKVLIPMPANRPDLSH
jgi:hypothetical protein